MGEHKQRTPAQTDGFGLAFGLGICAVLIWAGGPIATSYAVDQLDPIVTGVLRTILATLILLPAALLARLPLPTDRSGWALLLVAGLGGFVGFTLLYSLGQGETTTGHAAIILGASPIFTGFFGFLMQRSWPRALWWLGAAIAMAGVTLLVASRSGSSSRGEASLHGDLLIVGSIVCSSAGYATGGRLAARIGTWSVTAWGISIAGLVSAPIFVLTAPGADWDAVGTSGWFGLAYLAVAVSVIGYLAWYRAIGIAGVARIAPLQFGMPVISLIFATILFDEQITVQIVVATAVIVSGMILARRATTR